jgi:hypothetical protein
VRDVRFSNRPFGVKHFQTIHLCGVDVARGLVLLFGIGTWALVWGFFCQGDVAGRPFFFASFFVRSEGRFFVPIRTSLESARAGAVKVGRRANLAAYSTLSRPHLDSSEHDGTAWCGSDDDD